MLVYYFVPFIVSNRYLLFWVSNGHNSVTVQNRTHVYMYFFHHKDLGNHLLQLCPKVVKHPVDSRRNPWLSARFTACLSQWTDGRTDGHTQNAHLSNAHSHLPVRPDVAHCRLSGWFIEILKAVCWVRRFGVCWWAVRVETFRFLSREYSAIKTEWQ